jgi:SH3-like domain-containing protein
MRFRVLAVFWRLCLTSGLLMVSGQCGWSQSTTLHVPPHPQHDEPAKPPVAAPRQPVHQVGTPTAGSPPVVPPHGSIHPHKPPSRTGAAPAAVQAGTPPVPSAKTPAPSQPATEAPADATANKLPDPEKPQGDAAKLPRFASLRSDDVNMRLGPGTRYRIDWVYKRRDLPVEIEREYDVWRWVSDPDGNRGWVHQATLMGRRSFIVQNTNATLRSDPSETASAVAILQPGVIGRIRSCEAASEWCNVQTGSYRGYLRRQQFWGVLPGEAVTP